MRFNSSCLLLIGSFALLSVFRTPVFAAEAGADTEAIRHVQSKGWMTGYADGSFRPDRTVTKAELVKIIVQASGHGEEAERCRLRSTGRFEDVPQNAWFSKFVCAGMRLDLVKQPPDGMFFPGKKVTLAETAKMISIGMNGMKPEESDPWYEPYVRDVAGKGAVPSDVPSHQSHVSRAQLAEMLWRLSEGRKDLPSTNAQDLLTRACTRFEESQIPGVDLEEVKRTWLGWYNEVRASLQAHPLRSNKQLTRTAYDWSRLAAEQGSITHKRAGQSAYYDYARMTDWFASYDVEFANMNRITFTENIGWGVFQCPKNADCTKAFTDAVRTTFDMYMAERGKASAPHYNSIVNPEFRELGLGIVTKGNRYYLTAHYGTSITSTPQPLCP